MHQARKEKAILLRPRLLVQAQKAAIKAQRKAMDDMFQAMKRTYSELNSEQAELESALGSITARSLRSQPTLPAAMLSAMRSLPTLGLLTGEVGTPVMLSTRFCRLRDVNETLHVVLLLQLHKEESEKGFHGQERTRGPAGTIARP